MLNSQGYKQERDFPATGAAPPTGSEKAALSFWPLDGHGPGVGDPNARSSFGPQFLTNDDHKDGELKKGTLLNHFAYVQQTINPIEMALTASQMYLYPTIFDTLSTSQTDSHSGSSGQLNSLSIKTLVDLSKSLYLHMMF